MENDGDYLTESSSDCPHLLWKESIQIPLDDSLKIKILDFGNGCWTSKHFTQNIQTREYRGIETILDIEY
jgi:transcription initiation factor TFIID subunit TAF12